MLVWLSILACSVVSPRSTIEAKLQARHGESFVVTALEQGRSGDYGIGSPTGNFYFTAHPASDPTLTFEGSWSKSSDDLDDGYPCGRLVRALEPQLFPGLKALPGVEYETLRLNCSGAEPGLDPDAPSPADLRAVTPYIVAHVYRAGDAREVAEAIEAELMGVAEPLGLTVDGQLTVWDPALQPLRARAGDVAAFSRGMFTLDPLADDGPRVFFQLGRDIAALLSDATPDTVQVQVQARPLLIDAVELAKKSNPGLEDFPDEHRAGTWIRIRATATGPTAEADLDALHATVVSDLKGFDWAIAGGVFQAVDGSLLDHPGAFRASRSWTLKDGGPDSSLPYVLPPLAQP